MISAFVKFTVFVGVSLGAPAIKCPSGWFGSKCQYMCHCMPNTPCSATGDCKYGCEYGYFGHKCQYVDYYMHFDPRVRVNLTDCDFHDKVHVGYFNNYYLSHFTWARFIYKDHILSNYEENRVYSNMNSYFGCKRYYISRLSSYGFDFFCQPFLLFRLLIMKHWEKDNRCRIHFSRGRNLALKQQATDPITVDGDTGNSNCLNSSSWRVSLARPSYINSIIIHTDNENTRESLDLGTKLAENSGWVWGFLNSVYFNYYGRVWVIPNIDNEAEVSELEIRVRSNKTILFCEVEVIGDILCAPFHFGLECEHVCSCPFQKKDCDGLQECYVPHRHEWNCRYVCINPYFDQGCASMHQRTCRPEFCHNVESSCLECMPPYRVCENDAQHKYTDIANPLIRDCEHGTYGQGCGLNCSVKCENQTCDSITGRCLSCPPGWRGDYCEQDCDKHYYGKNCTETCSENCVDQLCNITDGVCLSCPVGRLGDFCDEACSDTTFGPNCKQQCDPDCVYAAIENKRLCDVITGDCVLKSKFPADPNVPKDVAETGLPREKLNSQDKDSIEDKVDTYILYLLIVLLALLIAILVCIFIRRKRKTVKTEAVEDTSVPIANLKVYILGHNKEFFLNQFKSIPTVYVGKKTSEKKDTDGTYDHACINVTPWPEKSPVNLLSPSFLALAKEEIILSQAPVAATEVLFLNLLWDKQVAKVAMVNTGKNDNEDSYWSMKDQNINCYRVKTVKTEVFLDYTIRTLEITKDDNPPRQLTHFQYTAWPEDGSDPCMWSLVDFEHKVFFNTLETVTLVHSGTDTTRSSVFIALHDLIRQAKLNQAVDFVDTVSRLRQDMPNTVQTFEQYMFLHHAAQAGIACIGSYTHISAIFLKVHLMGNVVNGKNNFENEFNNLFSFETQLTGGVGDVTQDPKDKKYQPLLQVDSPGEEGYINAVTLPSLYTQTKQFLTQLPMPTTVNDFWRLVTQYNVSLIVAFKSYENDKSLAIYLPEEQGQPLQCGNIAVNVESVTTAPTWTEMKLTVKGKQTQEVTHLTFTERHIEPKKFLPFVQYARSLRTPDKSVVYTCRNGAELSGLAYVVITLMDRLDQENYLTVPVVVGKVKSIRPHAIPTLQQYILVYETMKLYTEAVISTERHRAEYSSTV